MLWHYSEFKNLSTFHGFDFARAAEGGGRRPFPELLLPGRALPTAALAHSLCSPRGPLGSSCFSRPSIIHGRTLPRAHFPLSVAKEPRTAYWRCLNVNRTAPQARRCSLCSTRVNLPKIKGNLLCSVVAALESVSLMEEASATGPSEHSAKWMFE